MAPPSSATLSVVLLASSEAQQARASEIRDVLQRDFFRRCATVGGRRAITVQVRSGQVPAERLLPAPSQNKRNSNKTLFVVVGSETAASMELRARSVHAVLNTSSSNDSNDTATSAATPTAQQAALEIAKVCALHCDDDDSISSLVEAAVQAAHQAALVNDAALKTTSTVYQDTIAACYDDQQQITGDGVSVPGAAVQRGKVRDRWEPQDAAATATKMKRLALVTTDRQSGFDRQLAVVPYKGAVLNLCSRFWFDAVSDIVPNHMIATPHPSVAIVRKCTPFPIEFVVRSYMTGSTSTSIWKNYQNGVREYCGHILPEGMTKNMKLPENLLTPTTKEEDHDRPISLQEIVDENWMTRADLDACGRIALAVFARGREIAAQRGLILVDTKYEFGRCCETGEILLIDEVHTPDSSRYWLASSAEARIAAGREPENIDKEFLRLWFRDHCDPYKDESLPEAPRDLVLELSRRYIQLYEMITWNDFDFEAATTGEEAIAKAIEEYL